jgi:hypothetical protein
MKTFKHNSSESSLLLRGGVALSEYSFLSCQGYGSDAAYNNDKGDCLYTKYRDKDAFKASIESKDKEISDDFLTKNGDLCNEMYFKIKVLLSNLILELFYSKRLKISFLLIIFQFVPQNIQSQDNISEYYQLINKAEIAIIDSQYSNAILLYNQAYRIKEPSEFSLGNYIQILANNQYLKSRYIDSLIYTLNTYCINKVEYIKRDLKINAKYNCKEKFANKHCDSINKRILSFAEKDRNVRNNIIASGVAQKDMYKIEPGKSLIREVDSQNYFDIIRLLTENQNECITNILYQHALMDHMLKLDFTVTNIQLDTLLIGLAMNNILNKSIVASSLQNSYNMSSLHKPKEEYNFDQNIFMTDHFLIFPILDSSNRLKVDDVRIKFGLSNLKDHIRKTIWQRENMSSGFRFVYLAIFRSKSYEEELELIKSEFIYHKTKKLSNYKFNERAVNIFK